MKEFILIFRMDITTAEMQPSAEQMQKYMQLWMEWIHEIEDSERLAEGGNHLSKAGRVMKSGKQVLEGPFVEDHQSVAGYIIILAEDIEEASGIAAKCPILHGDNTSVEIREIGIAGE
jgi:hypothetical protein